MSRCLAVWKPLGQEIQSGYEPLCLIYEETIDGLDGSEFTRYWRLSDHWHLDHATCLENLLAVVAVSCSLGTQVSGSEVPMAQLQQLEAGKKLIPEFAKRRRGTWHPEDLIDPLRGQDTECRKALWEKAWTSPADDGIAFARLEPDPSAAKHTESVK